MTDATETPNGGTTDISDEEKQHTDQLGDGSPSGDATEDPKQDSDTTSGGEPE
jgi:hypothetical protein